MRLIDFLRTMPEVGDGRIFYTAKTQGAQHKVVNGFLLDTNFVFRNVQGLGVAILNPWVLWRQIVA